MFDWNLYEALEELDNLYEDVDPEEADGLGFSKELHIMFTNYLNNQCRNILQPIADAILAVHPADLENNKLSETEIAAAEDAEDFYQTLYKTFTTKSFSETDWWSQEPFATLLANMTKWLTIAAKREGHSPEDYNHSKFIKELIWEGLKANFDEIFKDRNKKQIPGRVRPSKDNPEVSSTSSARQELNIDLLTMQNKKELYYFRRSYYRLLDIYENGLKSTEEDYGVKNIKINKKPRADWTAEEENAFISQNPDLFDYVSLTTDMDTIPARADKYHCGFVFDTYKLLDCMLESSSVYGSPLLGISGDFEWMTHPTIKADPLIDSIGWFEKYTIYVDSEEKSEQGMALTGFKKVYFISFRNCGEIAISEKAYNFLLQDISSIVFRKRGRYYHLGEPVKIEHKIGTEFSIDVHKENITFRQLNPISMEYITQKTARNEHEVRLYNTFAEGLDISSAITGLIIPSVFIPIIKKLNYNLDAYTYKDFKEEVKALAQKNAADFDEKHFQEAFLKLLPETIEKILVWPYFQEIIKLAGGKGWRLEGWSPYEAQEIIIPSYNK